MKKFDTFLFVAAARIGIFFKFENARETCGHKKIPRSYQGTMKFFKVSASSKDVLRF